jgi:hypothetical protein
MSLARNLSKFKPSSSGLVETADIADNAITTAKITDANITTSKIADANITTAKVADDAVTAGKIEHNPAIVGNIEPTGSVRVDDGQYFQAGNSYDLQMYHDGSNSYIEDQGTGDLILKGTVVRVRSDNLVVSNASNNEDMITAAADGAVNLRHNNVSCLTTTSDGGIDIEGGDIIFSTAGKGIVLGATSNTDANTLEDYEEGSATVNMVSSGATFGFGGSDGSETTLYYVKIGRLVHYFMNWDSDSSVSGTTSNAVQVTNLPFSSSYGDTFSVWFHRGGPGAVDIMPTAYSTSMSFMVSPTAGGMWSDMTAGHLSHSDQRLRISGTTIVD